MSELHDRTPSCDLPGDASELLELQLTNMTPMQAKLVRAVLDEVRALRAVPKSTGEPVPQADSCTRCGELARLFHEDAVSKDFKAKLARAAKVTTEVGEVLDDLFDSLRRH